MRNKFIYRIVVKIKKIFEEYRLFRSTVSRIKSHKKNVIFYIGVPAHTNLGDLAQGVCIRRWLKKHYPDRQVIEIETNALVNTHFPLLSKLKKTYRCGDMIVFQSGYTTTDLGGFADEMHRAVMNTLQDAPMLMMPQTIFFQSEERKQQTSKIYNSMKHMLFLARDMVSYEMAKEMFPDIPVEVYPDIVTTLIGSRDYSGERSGILFCCRDDGEKYYSEEEIMRLMSRCKALAPVKKTDTTKQGKIKDIVAGAERYINSEIEDYSKYKLIITDRYHGTILSLVAGTPVVIIKTTDHKVTTGAEWFKGVYDEYVYLASDLDDAYRLAGEILTIPVSHRLEPYFESEYYDKLPDLFNRVLQRR